MPEVERRQMGSFHTGKILLLDWKQKADLGAAVYGSQDLYGSY